MAKQLVKHQTRVRGFDTNGQKPTDHGTYGGHRQDGDRVIVKVMKRGFGDSYSINPNGTLAEAPYIQLQFSGNHGWTALDYSWLGIKQPALGLAKKPSRVRGPQGRRRRHRQR